MNQISAVKRAYLDLYSLAGRFPRFILPLERLRHENGTRAAGKGVQIVIEGFPRSGNTFAQMAFELVQPSRITIAHHLHAPAQVLWAVQHRVPTIVLVREPVDAVVSVVIREYGEKGVGLAFRQYERFYRPLVPIRDQVVICRFHEVQHDFEPVIERVNAKWGTSFATFEHSPSNVQRCFDEIEEADKRDRGADEVEETSVARPSRVRETLAATIRPQVARHPRRQSAEELYMRFIENESAT